MPYLIVDKWNKENEGKLYTIGQSVTRIGRPSSNSQPEIPIDDPWVSRGHIEVVNDHDHFILRDVGSDNGTQLDGQQIESEVQYPLKHGSVIGLAIVAGKPRIVLRFWDSEDTTMANIAQMSEVNPVSWLRVEEGSKQVWVDGCLFELSKKEYDLLRYLSLNKGKLCSKDNIIHEVWSEVIDPGAVSDAAVETLIHRLREKVEPNPSNPARIISRKGFGYMLLE